MVTPLAGVWIEMCWLYTNSPYMGVTPLAGVWIEIFLRIYDDVILTRHSPCGSVD